MWIARFAVPVALILALFFACFAPGGARRSATVSAKEVLVQAQRAGGRSYTFSRDTAGELERVEVERPDSDASPEALEAVLGLAGFSVAPTGPEERRVFRVERSRG
jgi:hypothetical protein